MITIDRDGDTPEALARAAPDIHPRLIALTGDSAALAQARDAFQALLTKLVEAPDGAPVCDQYCRHR
jgi:cytochrome oxidase Cu insertion factor (SCO1/SenC/PrrC family)